MRTSLWVSAGWLVLLLIVSLTADRHLVQPNAALGAMNRQSSCQAPLLSPAHDTDIRSTTRPGERCADPTPTNPLDVQACYQNARAQTKQTTALSQQSPPDAPILLKGDRRHGQGDDRRNAGSLTVLADRRI